MQKVASTVLPDRDVAFVDFGQGNCMVAYKNNDHFHFYEYIDKEYKIKWQKPIPEGRTYDDYKHVSHNKTIFVQSGLSEVSLFNGALELIRKLPSPGTMIGLLSGGRLAVLTDHASPGSATSPVSLTVAPVDKLKVPVARLGEPRDGPYARQDELHACGRADGTVAVITLNKPFVDIYNSSGESLGLLHYYFDATFSAYAKCTM